MLFHCPAPEENVTPLLDLAMCICFGDRCQAHSQANILTGALPIGVNILLDQREVLALVLLTSSSGAFDQCSEVAWF